MAPPTGLERAQRFPRLLAATGASDHSQADDVLLVRGEIRDHVTRRVAGQRYRYDVV